MAKKTNKSSPSNVVAQARAGGNKRAPAKGTKGKSSQSLDKWLWENFKSLGGAILIFLVVRTLFIEAFRIPSGSMVPTLLVGDWLFVNKLAYGPTIPFTNSHLPGYTSPKHNDVVVFVSPFQPDEQAIGNDPTPTLVKRLIGMPGDTLYMRDAQLYLNGIPQRQGFAATNPTSPDAPNPLFDWQQRVVVKGSRFGEPPAQPTLHNWGPLVVPKDHYFMMGDNRDCSKDSRFWGVVPRDNIRGRPIFVYFSYVSNGDSNDATCNGETTDSPLPAITDIRWSRLGHIIR